MPAPHLPVRLTEWTSCGGCAAKWGAGLLADLLTSMPVVHAGDLLVGLDPPDDAAVLAIDDQTAWVSTTDFFPPLVDDPDDFGTIAAANACSDVFAMGADVRIALNVAAFPETLPRDVIAAIFGAAANAVAAAGGVLAGGHTIRSAEPIFGLAVQGTVSRDAIWTKSAARAGQVLLSSKSLGTGIALASGVPATMQGAIGSMRQLNRGAADQLRAAVGGTIACTDVTGFGLIGHSWEMASRSGVALHLEVDELPLLPGVGEAAANGVRTGGDGRNREAFAGHVQIGSTVTGAQVAVAFDPQTSGGLLAAVSIGVADRLVDEGWHRVGRVEPGPAMVVLG